jgi:hypothetical protein
MNVQVKLYSFRDRLYPGTEPVLNVGRLEEIEALISKTELEEIFFWLRSVSW